MADCNQSFCLVSEQAAHTTTNDTHTPALEFNMHTSTSNTWPVNRPYGTHNQPAHGAAGDHRCTLGVNNNATSTLIYFWVSRQNCQLHTPRAINGDIDPTCTGGTMWHNHQLSQLWTPQMGDKTGWKWLWAK